MKLQLTTLALSLILLNACSTSNASETPLEPIKTVTPSGDSHAHTSTTVLKNFSVVYREGMADGFANILCAADETLLGGGCFCEGDPSLQQSGTMFACLTNGNMDGYLGACWDDWAGQTYNPVRVRVQCGKGETTSVLATAPGLATVDSEDPLEAKLRKMILERRNAN
jgi:hypothetical protein